MTDNNKSHQGMSIPELWNRIIWLKNETPMLDGLYKRQGWIQGKGTWYKTQQQHWLGWLENYDGPGAYDRKIHKGRDAQFVYNHIMCPQMLLWLGEAAGVSKDIVASAIEGYCKAGSVLASQCKAIRQEMPFVAIEESLRKTELSDEQIDNTSEQLKKIRGL